jgi:hypothetical protein
VDPVLHLSSLTTMSTSLLLLSLLNIWRRARRTAPPLHLDLMAPLFMPPLDCFGKSFPPSPALPSFLVVC